MFGWGDCVDNYNPQILFAFEAKVDCSESVPIFKYHCHDFIELSIVLDGEVNYIVEGKDYVLKRGQLLLSNPGTYHKETPKDDSKYSQLHMAVSNIVLSEIKDNFIDNEGSGPIVTLNKYKDEFLICCDEIIKEQANKKLGYPLVLKTLIMKMLIMLCREIEGEGAEKIQEEYNCSFVSSEKHNIVKSIIEYMNSNYMDDISLDKISRNMYLSPVYISKIFKEETGDSPINHLIKIRLTKAEQLLKGTNMSIKSVAQSVGYSDAYHFSKLFKKYYGISPSDLKK